MRPQVGRQSQKKLINVTLDAVLLDNQNIRI